MHQGTEATGDFYQISNQTTLGKSEEDIISDFKLQVIPKGSGIVPRSSRDCKHWDGQKAATFGSKNGGPAVLSTQ